MKENIGVIGFRLKKGDLNNLVPLYGEVREFTEKDEQEFSRQIISLIELLQRRIPKHLLDKL